MSTSTSIRVSARVRGFTYAIRNIVAEAKKVEATGRKVRYLNIGDPIPFGFHTPPHLIAAVEKAMRDGHNGYTSSAGIEEARVAVANSTSRGMPISQTRHHHVGHVRRHRATLGAWSMRATSAGAHADLSLYRGARQDRREGRVHRTDPNNNWQPDLDDIKRLISPATRRGHRSNNPAGAVFEATRRADRDCRSRQHRAAR
jgi:alanine-synthesizing transaminase